MNRAEPRWTGPDLAGLPELGSMEAPELDTPGLLVMALGLNTIASSIPAARHHNHLGVNPRRSHDH